MADGSTSHGISACRKSNSWYTCWSRRCFPWAAWSDAYACFPDGAQIVFWWSFARTSSTKFHLVFTRPSPPRTTRCILNVGGSKTPWWLLGCPTGARWLGLHTSIAHPGAWVSCRSASQKCPRTYSQQPQIPVSICELVIGRPEICFVTLVKARASGAVHGLEVL